MELKWITDNLFPNFVQNLSIIATILGTVITCCVWFKTNKLYKLYNEKVLTFTSQIRFLKRMMTTLRRLLPRVILKNKS